MRAAPIAAFAFAVTMLSTTLPTPLYPLYEAQFGFDSLVVTAVYATYAVGVITALLTYGHVSDIIGRRPVLFAAIGFAAASAVVFLLADGTLALFPGRIFSGLSAGLFTGTGTAYIADLYGERRTEGALLATACNIGGLGLGPMIAAIAADLGNAPLRVPFWVDLILHRDRRGRDAARRPETIERTGPARPRLQRLAVPDEVRDVFVAASVGGFAGFAILGLFTADGAGLHGRGARRSTRGSRRLPGLLDVHRQRRAQVAFQSSSRPQRLAAAGLVLLIAGCC